MKKQQLFDRRRSNLVQLLAHRSYFDCEPMVRNRLQSHAELVQRLGLSAELYGHRGCVNGLEWNSTGQILASVSDDCHLMLWDPHRRRRLADIATQHRGNVFSVKFMPQSGDRHIATGAADRIVLVHDVERGSDAQPLLKCRCHSTRVKSLAVAPDAASMLWSSSEDGRVFQFDLREPHLCNEHRDRVVLIALDRYAGALAEVKCMAINGRRTEQIAVGANDPYARLYDRRKITPCTLAQFQPIFGDQEPRVPHPAADTVSANAVRYFCAGQFTLQQLADDPHQPSTRDMLKALTWLAFSPDGRELLVNVSGDQIYLFDVDGGSGDGRPIQLCRMPSAKQRAAKAAVGAKNHQLPVAAELLKEKGNACLKSGQLLDAIGLYTDAIDRAPDHAVPYLNRAAALMRRNYNGDLWAAARDCQQAIALAPEYVKAHFQYATVLLRLGRGAEADEHYRWLEENFPETRANAAMQALRKDIAEHRRTGKQPRRLGDSVEGPPRNSHMSLKPKEQTWRAAASDYEERFVGHCNTTTDIKQANFFGQDGRFVVAGSDDGNFFMWDRRSGAVTNVCRADRTIVNCVQPHPFACMLATSGIDDTVRLWQPQPYSDTQSTYGPYANQLTKQVQMLGGANVDDEDSEHAFTDWRQAVEMNQRRMLEDMLPLGLAEMMFYS